MQKWTLLIGLLLTAGIAQACDVCGCSAGGSSFGLLPNFHRHFMGIRYQYRSFMSEHHDAPGVFSTEQYHTAEVWGRWAPGKRFQLFAQVPYNHYRQTQEGLISSFDGPGDATLLAQIVLFNTGDSLGRSWRHGLQVGGGVKLPTGRASSADATSETSPSLLPGTGSFDFPILGLYTLRYGQWGANLEASYRINTANRDEYRFGNRLTGSLRVFYAPQKGKTVFMPNAGIQFEHSEHDTQSGYWQDMTGGQALLAVAGMEVFSGKWGFGCTYLHPVFQNLGDGFVQARPRFSANLMFIF